MDTRTTHSFVTENVLHGMEYNKRIYKVTLADGTLSRTKGKIEFSLRFSPSIVTRHTFLVCNTIMGGVDIILGQNWMSPRDASASVAAGKAQKRHHGKWVLLVPHTKGLRATLQYNGK